MVLRSPASGYPFIVHLCLKSMCKDTKKMAGLQDFPEKNTISCRF